MQEKKRGRPKQAHLRASRLYLRLRQHERAQLAKRVKALRYSSISSYVRALLFQGEKVFRTEKSIRIDPAELQKFRTSLTRVGVNLNQIARVLNAEQSVTKEAKHLAQTQEELLIQNKKIIEMLEG